MVRGGGPFSRAYHIFEKMVATFYERDRGPNANQWLVESDWLRVRARASFIGLALVHRVCQPFPRIKWEEATLGGPPGSFG